MRERILILPTLALVLMCLFSVTALAQDGEPPVADPINWLAYVALALNAVIIPLAANLLKRVWVGLPSIVKTFIPLVAGSVIAIAEAKLLEIIGTPIDLSLIEQILTGALGGGAAATVAFRFGETHGRAS